MKYFLVLLFVSNFAFSQEKTKKSVFTEDMLFEFTQEVNKRMPMTIDRDTTAENVSVSGKSKLIFNFRLENFDNVEAKKLDLINLVRQEIINRACSSEVTVLIKNGISIGYRYRSNEGKFVGEILVKNSDCK